jgi:hypothetical protein
MKCKAQYRLDHHVTERCYSPTACGAFGYCRERNFDGMPMDEVNQNRRKQEQQQEETGELI